MMRIPAILTALATLAMMCVVSEPADAERIVASLSTHRVRINSSFTGLELVLFGTVERDGASAPRRSGYDIVVTVTGPRETVVTRRKERVAGIWVNVDSRTFVDVPSYLAVLSTKPVDKIAGPEVARRLRLGLADTLLPQQIGADVGDVVPEDPFRMAFLRLKESRGLYLESSDAVTFRTPTLYSAAIKLPAEVPIGDYDVDVKLFADNKMIDRTPSAFEIIKVGFEQFVATAARDYSTLYGLATATMALMTGWFASIVFRRD
jgi:uncharacterized protein (TIGR02186 family)